MGTRRSRSKDHLGALFELSLSVGQSIQTEENCRRFLRTFCEKTQAAHAGVWVLTAALEGGVVGPPLRRLYFWGKEIGEEKFPQPADQIWERLEQEKTLSFPVPPHGCMRFYRLLYFGFLCVCHDERHAGLLAGDEVRQVIDQFAVSLQGGLAYHRLRQTEKLVSFNENRQRQILETSPDAIILVDDFARVLQWGRRAEELFGFTAGEVLGRRWYRFIREEREWEELDQKVDRFQEDGKLPYEPLTAREIVVKDKAGRRFPVEMTFSHLKTEADNIICLFLRDITERREHEAELIRTRTRLESLIANLQGGILVEDQSRRVVLVNRKFCEIFSIPLAPEQMIGADCAAAADQTRHLVEDPGGFVSRINELLDQCQTVSGDLVYMKSGLILERDYIPVSSDGLPLGHLWHYRDVTARKHAEAGLIQARQAAESAKTAERQFLAFMSHEIRTPLNTVIGMIHLLEETHLSKDQRDYVGSLRFSADSLLRIVNNILDLSKIEAGEIAFERHPFKLQDLLLALQQSFQFKLRNRPVDIEVECDPRIDHLIVGDYTRLNQILTNLMSNAVKFTDKGGIRVKVDLLEERDLQYLLAFNVADTGIGIDTQELSGVFENFRQAGPDTARRYGGTGLGLSIVRQLISLQGGEIQLESEKEKGTTVRFTLPLGRSEVSLSDLGQHPELPEELAMPAESLEGLKILVVEDNYLNQKLMQKILETWGCLFYVAADGQEALRITRHTTFDAILMDLHMPELDGVETSRLIREDRSSPNRDTPIIVLTAAALLEERVRVFEAGINDFLTKPFSPRVLKGLLLRWVRSDEEEESSTNMKQIDERSQQLRDSFPYLYDFSDGDEFFILDMAQTFLTEAPQAVSQMRQAIQRNDHRQVYMTAHRLHPNLQMMSLYELQKLTQQAEQLACQEPADYHQLGELIHSIEVKMAAALQEIQKKLLSLKPKQNGS